MVFEDLLHKKWQALRIAYVKAKLVQPYPWEKFRINENECGEVKTNS